MKPSSAWVWAGYLAAAAVTSIAAFAQAPDFTHELWGRTFYGDGYVYGPPYRSSGVAVVDIDVDGDNDFVLPAFRSAPQIMRNLGSNRSFYPGGPRDLNVPVPGTKIFLDRFMDFADLNSDGRPDLVVTVSDYNSFQAKITYYRNAGPLESPSFVLVQGAVYTSDLGLGSIGPVNLADIDHDGDKDLFFVKWVLSDSVRSHRLFQMTNTGSSSAPVWGTAVEITPLSNLMPPRYEMPPKERGLFTPWLHPNELADRAGKATFDPQVYDIEMADWDRDGDLDFMFYNASRGVDWVLNKGTAQSASWDTMINRDVRPYTQPDGLGRIFGSFAVRPSAFLPDFYVSIQGRLLTWRYSVQQQGYEVIQQSAVAYEAGQGPPAFWDYDGDGDLDLFRGGIGTGSTSGAYLLLFPNVGTPYEAVWGEYSVINDVLMGVGSIYNEYRQDLIAFDDVDSDGYEDLLQQGQDGAISLYYAFQPSFSGGLPTFYLDDWDVGSLWSDYFYGDSSVQPRGLAVADFSATGDRLHQLIAAYATAGGGRLFFLYQANALDWEPPVDISSALYDENGRTLNLNRIESMAAADIDLDGRPDLVLTLSTLGDSPWYRRCSHHFYRNTPYNDGSGRYYFDYRGLIRAPADADPYFGRMIAMPDIDTDGDADLFIGYQYFDPTEPDPNLNRYHYLRFFRNATETSLRFWQTRVVSGQQWRYYIGGQLPNYEYILNISGGDLFGGVYRAGPRSQVVDVIQSLNATPNYRIFIDVLPPVGDESKAILLIGGAANDPLYPTFEALAKVGYNTLLLQGLQKTNIRLFAPRNIDADGDGSNDVYGDRTLAGLQSSIVTWARGAQRLLVYLVDHGQRNRFRLNATDYLEASVYAGWLNQLQASTPNSTVTTVIDTCEAGSFCDELALPDKTKKAGAKRITIVSSGVGPTQGVALFDKVRNLSFSLPFWGEIHTGGSYGRAFDAARVAIQSINPLQLPQLDDSGNGIPDEASDGFLADASRAGADFAQPSSGVYIGEVAPNQAISTNAATLWLSDVVSNFPVEAAGALIVPPNLSRASSGDDDDEQPLTGLTWVDFQYDAALRRWSTNYSGFTEGGLYRVQYFVSALGRYYASPRIGFVDRLNIPDAWEPDNTSTDARWLPINLSQGHNFHVSGDEDWLRFTCPPNAPATIAVLPQGPNCRPRVRLYRGADLAANPGAAPLRDVTSPQLGKDVVFDHSFTTSEQHFLRITNASPGTFGAGTSYLVIAAVGTGGGIIPPVLVVSVMTSGANRPIEGVTVEAGSFRNVTSAEGVAQFVLFNDETYTVRASKSGYQPAVRSVLVNNQIELLTLTLSPAAAWSTDLDGNSRTDATDVQLVINGALGLPGPYNTDVNRDGQTNATDVQLVINGALGL